MHKMVSARFLRVTGAIALSLGLVACGGGGGGSPDPAPPAVIATGLNISPSLGQVLNADTQARCLPTSAVIGNGSTGSTGRVAMALTGSCSGPVMVSVIATASTTYFDEGANAFVAMTPVGKAMRAILPSLSGAATLSLGVTPLTEIAASQAIGAAGGNTANITAAQVTEANANAPAQVLGTSFDILAEPTLISSQPTSGNLGTSAADKYAFYLAALARAGGSTGTPALNVMNALATDFVDGTLGGGTSGSFSYTITNLSTQITAAISSAAGVYASSALQSNLGLGGTTPPPTLGPLTVSGFSPSMGAAGTTVSVAGTGFGTDTFHLLIKFGGNVTAQILSATDTRITAVVPAGASTGAITVVRSIPTPEVSATSATNFTVNATPPSNSSTWVVGASPSNFTLNTLAYGNGAFVAAGRGTDNIRSSSNGISWVSRSMPDTNFNEIKAITYSGTQFVAVGDTNTTTVKASIFTSTDGTTWTRRSWTPIPSNQFSRHGFSAVAAFGTKVLAAGENLATMAVSNDSGNTWTSEDVGQRNQLTEALGIAMNATTRVIVGRVGFEGRIIVDSGSGWTTTTLSDFYPRAVTWNGNAFIATGNSVSSVNGTSKAAYSADGITWTVVDVPTTPAALYASGIVAAGSTVYATFHGTASLSSREQYLFIYKSTDNGQTWSVDYAAVPQSNQFGDQPGMAVSPTLLVTVGQSFSYRLTLP